MQRLITVITGLSLAGCLPPPKDAGEVEDTDSDGATAATDDGATDDGATDDGATDDGGTATDGEPPEAEVEWTLELDPSGYIARMVRSPDGIVLAFQSDPLAPSTEVMEYSSAMALLWSQTLPDAGVTDLDALGGGEYLVAGATSMGVGTSEPTAWRVSCCSAVTSQTYPQTVDQSWIAVAEQRDDGIFLAIQSGPNEATFLLVPPALAPATTLATAPLSIFNGATTPSGKVLLRTDGGDVDLLYEVEPDGSGAGFGFGGFTGLVGTGDELTLMTFGEEQVEIRRFDENTWVPVAIPGFNQPYDEFVVDRHDRVVLVHAEGEPGGPGTLYLTEFGDDGVVARTLAIPHVQYAHAASSGVAVGEDGAIYLAVNENDLAGQRATYLHRIAPL